MNKIKDFICCKLSKESFSKYECVIIFLSLFWMIFYYLVIFWCNDRGMSLNFSWQLYPVFIILYIPLIHSFIYHIKNKNFKLKSIDVFFIFYLFFCVIATIFSEDKNKSIYGNGIRNEGLITIIMYFLIYSLGRNIVNKDNILKIINVLFGFGIWQVVAGLFQAYYTWNSDFDEMAFGFASNPNMFSLLIGMFAIMAISLYLSNFEKINKYKKYYLFCSILFYIGLLIGESAGPFFTFIGMLFVVFTYYFIKRTSIKKIFLLLIIFIVLFPTIQFSNRVVNEYYLRDAEYKKLITNNNTDYSKLYTDVLKIINIITPQKNERIEEIEVLEKTSEEIKESTNNQVINSIDSGRLDEWKNVIYKLILNWENGVGLDCLHIYYHQRGFLEVLDKAHNQYLDICVSIGIFGGIMYLVMVLTVFIKGVNNKNLIAKVVLFGFLYYSIAIFINISTPFVAMYYYIIIGLMIGLCEK